MDEHGQAITWDIQFESCLDAGLVCSQVRGMDSLSGGPSRGATLVTGQ